MECLDVSVGTTGIEEINIDLPAGTYYTGIDGYMGQQDGSPHTMTMLGFLAAIAGETIHAAKSSIEIVDTVIRFIETSPFP